MAFGRPSAAESRSGHHPSLIPEGLGSSLRPSLLLYFELEQENFKRNSSLVGVECKCGV